MRMFDRRRLPLLALAHDLERFDRAQEDAEILGSQTTMASAWSSPKSARRIGRAWKNVSLNWERRAPKYAWQKTALESLGVPIHETAAQEAPGREERTA